MLGEMKLREKSSVFRRCLKISSEGAERAVDGKLFHARVAATLKESSFKFGRPFHIYPNIVSTVNYCKILAYEAVL